VDVDADACGTYTANFGPGIVRQADLATIEAEALPRWSGLGPGEVDLLVGGPPCQGVSSAGAKDWDDPRNILFTKFVAFVTALRPSWFIMENVEGLLTAREGFFITEAITRFLEAGYWVRTKKVYMEQYGLPQQRKRVLVVGNLERCPFDFPPDRYQRAQVGAPSPSHAPSSFAGIGLPAPLTILDAIDDLPAPTPSDQGSYLAPARNEYQRSLRRTDAQPLLYHQQRPLRPIDQQRIRLLGQGETMRHLPSELQHASFTRRAFRRVMDGTPTERRGGAPAGMKRLFAAKPSLTITSASSSEFIHPIEDRLLTPRECARLQSLPDWFTFCGSWGSISTQIGNAIPPVFMETLARHIRVASTRQRATAGPGRWLGIEATRSAGMSPILSRVLSQLEERTHAFTW
jgi:DNA (cytosine-5)-methyltransferase 1